MGDALFKFTKAWSKSGYNPAGSEGAESDGEEEDLQPSRTASQGMLLLDSYIISIKFQPKKTSTTPTPI